MGTLQYLGGCGAYKMNANCSQPAGKQINRWVKKQINRQVVDGKVIYLIGEQLSTYKCISASPAKEKAILAITQYPNPGDFLATAIQPQLN